MGSPSWCKMWDRRESVLGGVWPGKLDTFVPRFRVRALKATAWMGFLFIQCNQEAVTSTKCPSVPLSSKHKGGFILIWWTTETSLNMTVRLYSTQCSNAIWFISPSLQRMHNNQKWTSASQKMNYKWVKVQMSLYKIIYRWNIFMQIFSSAVIMYFLIEFSM